MMNFKNRTLFTGILFSSLAFISCYSSEEFYKNYYSDDVVLQKKLQKENGEYGSVLSELSKAKVIIEVKKGSVFINIEDSRKQNSIHKSVTESETLTYLIGSNRSATFSFSALDEEAVFTLTYDSKTTEYTLDKYLTGKSIIISNFNN